VEAIQQWIPSDQSPASEGPLSPSSKFGTPEMSPASRVPSSGGPSLPFSNATDSFADEVKEIQSLPQYLFRERNCQFLLLLLHQRK
jgi:hypothetical protein